MSDVRCWGDVHLQGSPLRVSVAVTHDDLRTYYFSKPMRDLNTTGTAMYYWQMELYHVTRMVEQAIERDIAKPYKGRSAVSDGDDSKQLIKIEWPRTRLIYVYRNLCHGIPAKRQNAIQRAMLWEFGLYGCHSSFESKVARVLEMYDQWLKVVKHLAFVFGKSVFMPIVRMELDAAKRDLDQALRDLSALSPILDGALKRAKPAPALPRLNSTDRAIARAIIKWPGIQEPAIAEACNKSEGHVRRVINDKFRRYGFYNGLGHGKPNGYYPPDPIPAALTVALQ